MQRLFILAVLTLSCLAKAQQPGSVPGYLLQLPASISTVLIAETNSSTLHRFVVTQQGAKLDGGSYISVGQNGVDKYRAWDRRTPLGIYFINEQLDTSRLHEKYGPTAFPLDYPNAWDHRLGRSGDGIWIHGVAADSERRPPLDTDGCIALPNDELLAVAGLLTPLVTPVIITRDLKWIDPQQVFSIRERLHAALDEWTDSYLSGDLYRYLRLYSNEFQYRGMNENEWSAYRLQTIGAAEILDFSLDDVLLLADPEEDGLYLSRFRQTIVDATHTVVTIKRLYWRESADGNLRIVAEDNG
ncbi:MAG: L,D-transpeptidase family protein [Gammaproteobacteria bacterium]|nr:L,D-transpeptidase family protein [Gammaproteobacteria bacterium]MDH3414934.1 L,D-transpeptidase family protein [Gammaproteobacteria bacterium]